MKNIDEKILITEEEIKQLQNKRKKLISQQKQEERKKRDRRLYEKGAVFESIFTESKDFTKDEFYQLITFPNIKEVINQKNQENHGNARRKWKSKYRNERGRNGHRGIVPCLQGRTYTP
ncbi:hypothetical protein HMPREF9628_02080 [Peptoanaerobacter stomatis]|uniref:PF12958 family protein n=1 Tax=Peptoanaerobacter stomatis TaxID=796937 RepID=G9XEL0_9FIRM|nr:hypothetical protein HMPREF9628_02080 [Peptoanaerobacter stomatis]